MADEMDNLKQGFSDPRTRLIVVFMGGLAIVALIFGLSSLRSKKSTGSESTAKIETVKNVNSVPGAVNQTEEYANLQRKQNVKQAKKAMKRGTSAIPTIVGSELFSSGKQIETIDGGKAGVGFSALSRLQKTNANLAWMADVQQASCDADSLRRAVGQGASIKQLREVGCPTKNLCELGYRLADMAAAGFTAKELRECGHSAKDLKGAGYSYADLRKAGFSACDLKALGATAEELAKAGFSAGELKGAGYAVDDIRNAEGIPSAISDAELNKIKCSPEDIRMAKEKGLSAGAIRKIAGCTANQLRDGGYNLKQLRQAGFSAASLSKAGYTPSQLKAAGFSAEALRKAGYSAADLRAAGFNPTELSKAGFTSCDLKKIGIDAKSQKQAGASVRDLIAGGFSETELLAAGFDNNTIASQRPSQQAMQALLRGGCSVESLKQARLNQIPASIIKRQLNCSVSNFRSGGYTAAELRRACFTADQLKAAGYSAADLKAAGFSAADLKAANFSPQDLANAGFSAAELASAGFSAKKLRDAGFSAAELKDAGFNAKELKTAGYSAGDLKAAGYTPADLKSSGFSAEQLKNAGFSATDMKNAGFTPKELIASGFTPEALKEAGFSAKTLMDSGLSAKQLKAAGFTPEALKKAGVPLKELLAAGYTPKELKEAGYKAKELLKAGVTANELRKAGYSAKNLIDAGATPEQLKSSGYSARALVDAGASVADLLRAGFSPKQLKRAGVSTGQLKRAADDVLAEADSGDVNLSKDQLAKLNALANGLLGEEDPEQNKLEQFMQLQNKQMTDRLRAKDIKDALNNMERYARQVVKEERTAKQETVAGSEDKQPRGTVPAGGTARAQQAVLDPGYEESDISISEFDEHFTRAGDVTFAVLDTAINSDEPGPIMATVISGPFRGAKLLGTLGSTTTDSQKISLNFSSMTLPGVKASLPLSAIAIDPGTARTALSSKTDNHLLLRYGSMFASSFMSGYASAISERGTTVSTSAAGDTTVTSTPLNGKEQLLVGLGEVGTQWASQVRRNFNRKPTIHVYSGTNMAILFTQDFAVKLPVRQNF